MKKGWLSGLVETGMRTVPWLYSTICRFWFIWDPEISAALLNIAGIFSTAKWSGSKGRDAVWVLWVADESILPFFQVQTVGEPPI